MQDLPKAVPGRPCEWPLPQINLSRPEQRAPTRVTAMKTVGGYLGLWDREADGDPLAALSLGGSRGITQIWLTAAV